MTRDTEIPSRVGLSPTSLRCLFGGVPESPGVGALWCSLLPTIGPTSNWGYGRQLLCRPSWGHVYQPQVTDLPWVQCTVRVNFSSSLLPVCIFCCHTTRSSVYIPWPGVPTRISLFWHFLRNSRTSIWNISTRIYIFIYCNVQFLWGTWSIL